MSARVAIGVIVLMHVFERALGAEADLVPSDLCVRGEGQARAQACSAEQARIARDVASVYGLDRHSPLADFRDCRDFMSCFKEACEKTPAGTGIDNRDLKTASRPLIMFNRSGGPSKGVVVLGHGLGGSPYDSGWIADELSKRGYHVIAGLLPGHGADHYGPQQMITADDYRNAFARNVAFARKLFPSLPLVVGGSSTSGALAVDFLLTHKDQQANVQRLLLFDPALALDSTAESLLRREWFRGLPVGRGALAAAESAAAAYTGEGRNDSPAWFGFKGSVHARPVVELIDGIRRAAKKATIPTPTYAVFSNGRDDIVPIARSFAKIVDPQASRASLYGADDRGGGLLSAQKKGFLDLGRADPAQGRTRAVLHRQVTIKEDIGKCKRHPLAGDNPYFDEMMEKVAAFLSTQEGDSRDADQQTRPSPK